MKSIAKFVFGNSIVTPAGVAVAIVCALVLRGAHGAWLPVAYGAILLVTLLASTFERVS